ncbi:hypothetical protein [Kitasatospora sp. NPDC094011]|uniref:hypothetical protein n=1 Tax=Kitasatospora sp. NPDC094011 TaxID=3364090 RepID=UPI0037F8BBFD
MRQTTSPWWEGYHEAVTHLLNDVIASAVEQRLRVTEGDSLDGTVQVIGACPDQVVATIWQFAQDGFGSTSSALALFADSRSDDQELARIGRGGLTGLQARSRF